MKDYINGMNSIFEVVLLVLMLSDIFLLISLIFVNLNSQIYMTIVYFDLCVCLILMVEFSYRLWRSENKKKFIWNNWTDILGMIPEIVIGPVSTIFRYFRFIKIIKILALFKKEIRHFLNLLHETRIDYGFLIVLSILLISATIFYFVEYGINPNVDSFDDAFWYLMVTITTVGYGDIYPKTEAGRIIGTIIMFTGIGFMSFLTATLTSAIIKNRDNNSDDIHDKLDKLHLEINELKEIIKSNK